MSKSDAPTDREMLERMRAGWAYMEAERRRELSNLVTKDEMVKFESAFAYAQTLPPRMDSGLVAFYQALGRASGRCSI